MGDKNPTHLFAAVNGARRKMQHVSPWNGVGKAAKGARISDRIDRSEDRESQDLSDLQYEAFMCYLRGLCYSKTNAIDRAKACYKDAVKIDVQCFEAFDQLMSNKLMAPAEEWQFLESLDFDSIVNSEGQPDQEAAEFTKMLYTTRLSKYSRPEDFSAAVDTLSSHYNLANNASMLLARAELLFTDCRFKQSLELTTTILESDPYNFEAIPVHIACLEASGETNALFLLSHDLADTYPDEPATWLAVGTYYMAIQQISQARAYFSKASLMDPHFGPAWIGFAHTFAAEGEHDQAISAYSTAARLFQGTHLPPLFLGMQNLSLGNTGLARSYFDMAYDMCPTDPLLLNDIGVTNYNENLFDAAIRCFELSLRYAEEVSSPEHTMSATRSNLGHALRKAGRLSQALAQFDAVLRLPTKDPAPFLAKALTLLMMDGKGHEALAAVHHALALAPQDPMAGDLLQRALEAVESVEPAREGGLVVWEGRRLAGSAAVGKRSRRRRRPVMSMEVDDVLSSSLVMD